MADNEWGPSVSQTASSAAGVQPAIALSDEDLLNAYVGDPSSGAGGGLIGEPPPVPAPNRVPDRASTDLQSKLRSIGRADRSAGAVAGATSQVDAVPVSCPPARARAG